MPELSRREQNKVGTRARIIAAAAEKFLIQGVEQSTVSEVARHAGVSRGTFFNYFPTKDSVLTASWEDMTSRFARVAAREMGADVVTDHLEKIMKAGQTAGDVRTGHDARFLAQMVTAGYIAAGMRWRENPDFDAREEFAETADFLADSILPRPITDKGSIA